MKYLRKMLAVLAMSAAVLAAVAGKGDRASAAELNYLYVFDADYYANHNADVKAAFGMDAEKLFNHFITYGMDEGRQANAEFNVDVYRRNYADLNEAFGDNKRLYYVHYMQFGHTECRKAIVGKPVYF